MFELICAIATDQVAVALFILGVCIMGLLIRRREGLTFAQVILALIGLRRFDRTLGLDVLHAATILIPLGLMVLTRTECGPISAP